MRHNEPLVERARRVWFAVTGGLACGATSRHQSRRRGWVGFGVWIVLATLGLPADQVAYDDALENGWANYGWATLNYSNPTPVHSGVNSISVSASAYQALYLHHSAFNSGLFSNLVFWIHGGTTGGQNLQVQATLNGAPQAGANLPALTTNWQQIVLPLAALGVGNQPNLDGLWIQSRSGALLPTFYVDDIKLTAASPPSIVNLRVVATQPVRTVDARVFALNTAVWDAVLDTSNTMQLLQDMGAQALRYPGGSLSDTYHWAINRTGTNTWQWASGFGNFLHIATNVPAQVFITANYGSGTPAEAAAWVRSANITNKAGFKFWEIGNECYGAWETDTNARPHDPVTYATRFKDYWSQMKTTDPTIKIGAVAVTGEDSSANYTDHAATNSRTLAIHYGWTPVLLATLRSLGVTPDFLIYHRYAQGPGGEDDTSLLLSSATWSNDAADLRQQLSDYLGTAGTNVELVCTENNSVYTNPGKQTTSLVNGLFLADSIAQLLQTEFNACCWWDLRNGQETANNNSLLLYGWRPYGDYGITDGSDPSSPASRYPTFYTAKLLKHFARGGDQVVRATSDYPLLSAYAVGRTNGSLAVLVLNKHAAAAATASLNLAGYLPGSNAIAYSYGIPQDDAARTGLGSCDVVSSNLVFSPPSTNLTFIFAPYSATVLSFSPPRLALLPPVRTNGQFQLRILGQPQLRYLVQTSANLRAWSPATTNTMLGDSSTWLDSTSSNQGARFYRGQWLP